jgi:glucokinase
MILVGDVGGTNTTLALLSHSEKLFRLERRQRYASLRLSGLEDALGDFLAQPHEELEVCCLSGAGPARDNRCTLTNVPWLIDGKRISHELGIPTFVINDFTAICYALPLIDTHDAISAIAFPRPDGTVPVSAGSVRAVIGAGTGLGTGYLTMDKDRFFAHASEGGHSDFATTDDEMRGLAAYLADRHDFPPGAEQYVSGQCITNAFRYLAESRHIANDPRIERILSMSDSEIPGAVAGGAEEEANLADIMRLFVRMYARYASNTALFLLPTGGLYLAGGIAAKNLHWFTDDHLFMNHFVKNYNAGMRSILRSIPVHLITAYDVSLYGAAHAAISLQ